MNHDTQTLDGTAIYADQARGGLGGQCRHIWHTWSVWDRSHVLSFHQHLARGAQWTTLHYL